MEIGKKWSYIQLRIKFTLRSWTHNYHNIFLLEHMAYGEMSNDTNTTYTHHALTVRHICLYLELRKLTVERLHICDGNFITVVKMSASIGLCSICHSFIWKSGKNKTFRFLFFCRSSDEVLHILSNILGALQRGRTSLVIPKKKPIDELMKSRNMVRNAGINDTLTNSNSQKWHWTIAFIALFPVPEIVITKFTRWFSHQFLFTKSQAYIRRLSADKHPRYDEIWFVPSWMLGAVAQWGVGIVHRGTATVPAIKRQGKWNHWFISFHGSPHENSHTSHDWFRWTHLFRFAFMHHSDSWRHSMFETLFFSRLIRL